MDAECPHLIPDENWNCEDCGTPIPMPTDLPEPKLDGKKLVAICRLMDATRVEFDKVIKANTDPKDPSKPRLRMVGGQMMRLPHKMVINGISGTSFVHAKQIGFRGSKERWIEMVMEDIPTFTSATL